MNEQKAMKNRVRRLISKLGATYRPIHEAAERELYSLGPAAMETLVSELERAVRNRKWLPAIIIGYAIGYPLAVYFVFAILIRDSSGWIGVVIGGLPAPIWVLVSQSTKIRNIAGRVLSNLEDIRAVGPLLEALRVVIPETRPEIESALQRLLPELRMSDAHLLTTKARESLNNVLLGDNSGLILAALAALEQIGDSQFIANVTRLSEGEGRACFDEQVRTAAKACLPALLVRAETERDRQVLLRPSEHQPVYDGSLVRPAMGLYANDEHVLLRSIADRGLDEPS